MDILRIKVVKFSAFPLSRYRVYKPWHHMHEYHHHRTHSSPSFVEGFEIRKQHLTDNTSRLKVIRPREKSLLYMMSNNSTRILVVNLLSLPLSSPPSLLVQIQKSICSLSCFHLMFGALPLSRKMQKLFCNTYLTYIVESLVQWMKYQKSVFFVVVLWLQILSPFIKPGCTFNSFHRGWRDTGLSLLTF